LKIYKKFLEAWKAIATIILLICILGIVSIMLSELVARNLFNSSFRWSTELNGFLFMWMSFMGLIILINENRMISLDMVYVRVNPKIRGVLWLLIQLAIFFLGLVMVISYKDMYPILATSKFSTMQWLQKTWHYLPSAIAGAFFVAQSVYELFSHLFIVKSRERRS